MLQDVSWIFPNMFEDPKWKARKLKFQPWGICHSNLKSSRGVQRHEILLWTVFDLMLTTTPVHDPSIALVFQKARFWVSRGLPCLNSGFLRKPQRKFTSVHLGIAQIAIGPPPPLSNGHSVAPIFGQNQANARWGFPKYAGISDLRHQQYWYKWM